VIHSNPESATIPNKHLQQLSSITLSCGLLWWSIVVMLLGYAMRSPELLLSIKIVGYLQTCLPQVSSLPKHPSIPTQSRHLPQIHPPARRRDIVAAIQDKFSKESMLS